jgi:hypothetical protein
MDPELSSLRVDHPDLLADRFVLISDVLPEVYP